MAEHSQTTPDIEKTESQLQPLAIPIEWIDLSRSHLWKMEQSLPTQCHCVFARNASESRPASGFQPTAED
jgi:hypothetical protein